MALGLCYRLCYKTGMPKPPTSVRSIRLTDDLWSWVSEEAARRDVSVNALMFDLAATARAKADLGARVVLEPSDRSTEAAVERFLERGGLVRTDEPLRMPKAGCGTRAKKGAKK